MTMSHATEVSEDRAAIELAAETVIEHHRYSCEEDRLMARHPDGSDIPTLMPSADELSEMGFDIIGLAKALDAGLDAELFGLAHRLLVISEFNIALAAGLDIALYNEGMDHLADIAAERA